jgi:hypothetical protein
MRAYAYLVIWLLFHFAAHGAPTDLVSPSKRTSALVKREPKDAGIGVELEVRIFVLTNEGAKDVTDEQIAAVKGSTLVPANSEKKGTTCKTFWDLTAEIGGADGTGMWIDL